MSQVVRNAQRVATTINVVKIVLMVVNVVAGAVVMVIGRVGTEQASVNSNGFIETGRAVNGSLIVGGLLTAVVGTLLIYVLLGWFEHVLRTLAAVVENTTVRPAVQSVPGVEPTF
jgi:small-conductance mechanosensitive channel